MNKLTGNRKYQETFYFRLNSTFTLLSNEHPIFTVTRESQKIS